MVFSAIRKHIKRTHLGTAATVCGVLLLVSGPSLALNDGFESQMENPTLAPVLACAVDTAGIDQFTEDTCLSLQYGGARRTTAHFHVLNINPDDYAFTWSIPSCDTYQCERDITAYRNITVDVAVTHLDTGESWLLSAEAIYENGY
ncbi:MAG: hypothetical protein MI750_05920 [Xanthomonadales bacterium]|nr:hypothetical protein [Xanthomonadales bacterium]